MSEWIWTVVELLMPVLAALIGAVFYFAAAWLKNRAEAIKNEDVRKFTQSVIYRSTDAVREAVLATKQQLVDDFKEASENGKLTDEEKQQAFNAAKDKFYALMGEYGLSELKIIVDNVDEWINTAIESWVQKLGEG